MPSDAECPEIFDCTMCGECCKGFGGTYLSQRAIGRIADYLSLTPEQFVKSYCQSSGRKLVIAQGKDGYCVFHDGSCRIHPVKPRMCRQWPYIPSVLTDVGNWKIMADSCPGMKTDLPDKIVRECVRRELARS